MPDRIALQLYSVRDVVAREGYEAVIRGVAGMGYKAVETAGFPGTTVEAARHLFDELGLTVAGAHVPLPLAENKNMVLDTMEALGKPTLVCTQIGRDDVVSLATVQSLCERLNEGFAVARENNLDFAIHNHWWEFGKVDGRLVHEIMLGLLDPGIKLEVDTYWVKVGGFDPVQVLKNLGSRATMLHIKDGPANKEGANTALGEGSMDIPNILTASGTHARWLVFEMDRCDTDSMEAARKSYDYLSSLESAER